MICCLCLFYGTFIVKASAEDIRDMDNTAIESDLGNLDITEYPKDESGAYKIIYLQEYCYSERPLLKENYGVYIYVYNPAEKEIKSESDYNVVNMATEYNESGEPCNYENVKLIYLDSTANKRFYKFKLSDSLIRLRLEREYMQRHGKRRYDIAGMQLHYKGELQVTDVTVGLKYEWTGFAHGCGAEYDAESTLQCNYAETETLYLEPTPTVYRPEGTNGKNDYTQDSLHSVWFSVPNEYMEKYGELYALHATYLNAVLKPMLVTGNRDIYSSVRERLGIEYPRHDQSGDFHYGFMSEFEARAGAGNVVHNYCKYGFNLENGFIRLENCESVLSAIYGVFYAGSGNDSADSYTVSSAALQQCLAESKNKFGGETVLGKYSRAMFDSVDNTLTDIRITRNETYSLTSEKISSTWWERLWGGSHTEFSHTFDGIEAIRPLTYNDFSGTDKEVSDRLYIDESDVSALKTAAQNSGESTYYLFRYQVSDYESSEVKEGEWEYRYNALNPTASGWTFKDADTNAYFFKETVNLDFDIIDVTFNKNGTLAVIPVVMSPIDVIPSATPPVYTETDTDKTLWWKLLLGLAGLILLIIILAPVLPYIIQGVWFVITLPVKAIVRLVKAFSKEKPK